MSGLDLDALERRAHKGIVLNPDETLALITRLRAAEARTAWQPIETAPLEDWLLCAGNRILRIARRTMDGGWRDTRGHQIYGLTHWQRLPAAPEAP